MTARLYDELADWFHLLTAPADYAEEAAFYRSVLDEVCAAPPKKVLELGSGGGNNASHLTPYWRMTLVDLSPGMLELSAQLNPDCEHVQGDMRTVRLDRQFDAVFVHDAVAYITTLDDLRATMETPFVHCAPGGAALFAPDDTWETLHLEVGRGGHDGEGRSLRYLSWTVPPKPGDSTCVTDYVYLLREGDAPTRMVQDRHVTGLFHRADWLRLLAEVGFEADWRPSEHSEFEEQQVDLYVGRRPAS